METKYVFAFIIIGIIFEFSCGRIHKVDIKDDERRYIAFSTFGFYKGGILDVKLINFRATPFHDDDVFGFSLDRSSVDELYLDNNQGGCHLQAQSESNEGSLSESSVATVNFILDFKEKRLRVSCNSKQSASGLHSIQIYKNASSVPSYQPNRDSSLSQYSGPDLVQQHRPRRSVSEAKGSSSIETSSDTASCTSLEKIQLPMTVRESPDGTKYFNANFVIYVASESDEGLYNLYFYNCPNYKEGSSVSLNFSVEIEENNNGNFLSAGEMHLPALYFMVSLLFFLSGSFWFFILRKSKNRVHRIHYLMAVLIYLKTLSLMFNGTKYYFIQTKGEEIAAWTVLYYVSHLLKNVVLLITIILLGSGWTIIKHSLSGKDKMILMIVIPIQILASVAEIIIEESEKEGAEHQTWRHVFIIADLLCSGFIIFSVFWSLRLLQKTSHIYGKAAGSLRTLFRHFFIMLLCYIYLSRIVVYLIKITVDFQYEWLVQMFQEMNVYIFFVLTGYKFRPASISPYFQLSADDDDDDEKK